MISGYENPGNYTIRVNKLPYDKYEPDDSDDTAKNIYLDEPAQQRSLFKNNIDNIKLDLSGIKQFPFKLLVELNSNMGENLIYSLTDNITVHTVLNRFIGCIDGDGIPETYYIIEEPKVYYFSFYTINSTTGDYSISVKAVY
jgi:TFIIF-interacting CTD phosphatase-like protein